MAREPLFLDAVLTPHRSLSQKGFARLLGGFALVNMALSAVFVAQGAYPVVFFLALDVGLLWLAFAMNYRAGRAQERVRVSPIALHVVRQSPQGRLDHWVVSPLWARVRRDEAAVQIAASGQEVPVGAFLSPEERASFQSALEAALLRARREGFGGISPDAGG